MNHNIRQAVIFAGGIGSRLRPFTQTNPKPMYPIEGVPFIIHLLLQIKAFGIKKILLLLGYLPEKIISAVGDGSALGLDVEYEITPVDYDTGLRLWSARDRLDDIFLLMYCDNYCPIDIEAHYRNFIANDAAVQLLAYVNHDHYTKSNLNVQKGQVLIYDKSRNSRNLHEVDIGYAIVKKAVLCFLENKNINFEAAVYPMLVQNKNLFATLTEHRYYSIGSMERIALTKEFFKPKKVVFLDRDGTINKRAQKACYIERPEDFVLLAGAAKAVKMLKDAGFFLILITNQPGIARGRLSEMTLEKIHMKMMVDLSKNGGAIDAIYYCPHDWDEGCDCRKPNPGMLFQAQKDFSLNLLECVLIGDDERDITAGSRAGCTCYQVSETDSLLDIVEDLLN